MKTPIAGSLFLVAVLVSGCGPVTLPEVSVEGKPKHLREFDGTWTGTWENRQTHRSGTIEFRLVADADSAFGEVMMHGTGTAPGTTNRPMPTTPVVEPPTWQNIRFVRMEKGYVSGEMEPYYEPRCQCTVVTRFLGKKEGDRIEGGFTARGLGRNYESSGTWQTRRVRED